MKAINTGAATCCSYWIVLNCVLSARLPPRTASFVLFTLAFWEEEAGKLVVSSLNV